jgi:hypothetical protein
VTFDWTVNLGTVVSGLALAIMVLGLHRANIVRITRMETKLDMLYEWWKERR